MVVEKHWSKQRGIKVVLKWSSVSGGGFMETRGPGAWAFGPRRGSMPLGHGLEGLPESWAHALFPCPWIHAPSSYGPCLKPGPMALDLGPWPLGPFHGQWTYKILFEANCDLWATPQSNAYFERVGLVGRLRASSNMNLNELRI